MEYNHLPKDFFKKNPLHKLSAAQILYFSMTAGFGERLDKEVFDLVKEAMDTGRLDKINREREEISHLETGEDFVRFMRSRYDISNRIVLCKRALTMQQEVIPPMLHRFRTSIQDIFIEASVYILAHAEQVYVDQLKALYPEIRNPYAQSLACLVFGMQKQEDTLPLLLAEYQRLQQEFPEESLCQGPLLAIYILYNKA